MLLATATLAILVVLMTYFYFRERTCSKRLAALLAASKTSEVELRAERDVARAELASSCGDLVSLRRQLAFKDEELSRLSGALATAQTELKSTRTELKSTQADLGSTQTELAATQTELASTQISLASTQTELKSTQSELKSTQTALESTQAELSSTQDTLRLKEDALSQAKTALDEVTADLEVEREVNRGVTELGVKHARSAASLSEALKTKSSQRSRWIKEAEGLSQELASIKGKAARTEAIFRLLERILER